MTQIIDLQPIALPNRLTLHPVFDVETARFRPKAAIHRNGLSGPGQSWTTEIMPENFASESLLQLVSQAIEWAFEAGCVDGHLIDTSGSTDCVLVSNCGQWFQRRFQRRPISSGDKPPISQLDASQHILTLAQHREYQALTVDAVRFVTNTYRNFPNTLAKSVSIQLTGIKPE